MRRCACVLLTVASVLLATSAWGELLSFSTGHPDGKLAAASRIEGGGLIEIETGDDFITTADQTLITGASFWGLLPSTPLRRPGRRRDLSGLPAGFGESPERQGTDASELALRHRV